VLCQYVDRGSKKLCVVSVCRQGLRRIRSVLCQYIDRGSKKLCVLSVCRQGLWRVRSCMLCQYVDRDFGQ
jgi:hypothetical protein